jgi:hypothetical protein
MAPAPTPASADQQSTVDSRQRSRYHNVKELRTGSTRILFCFDPQREAVLLVAGDKRGQLQHWYTTAIPLADDRYDEWMKSIATEGGTP